MFNTSIVEVAIGLIFVFSLLAILVTQINTLTVNLLNLRAKQLKEGLQDLITDKYIQAKLLTHPVINMVNAPEDADDETILASPETKVTYIEPAIFVQAMIDILIAEADALYQPLQDAAEIIPNSDQKSRIRELIRVLRSGFSEQTLRSLRDAFNTVDNPESRAKLLEGLESVEEALKKLNFKSDQLVPLLEGVRKITDKRFKGALETILKSARTIDEAQYKIQTWFNDGMSRASAMFTRRLGYISVIVALTSAVILNVDTLQLARALWEDPELRRTVALAATQSDQGTDLQQPPASEAPAAGTDGVTTLDDVESNVQDIGTTIQNLLELQLPIGWEYTAVTDEMIYASRRLGMQDPRENKRNIWNLIPGNTDRWFGLWLEKILGFIATAIAAAQGAPFWFDLLNKISRR